MEDAILVTGADSKFFLMACLLYQSVKPTSLAKNFFILDFGLRENEKAFFRSKGILVDAPAPAAAATHPWALKAMLYDHVAKLPPASNVIWIDSDILVNRNFAAALRTLLDGMAEKDVDVAASPEMPIGDFISAFSNLSLWPFIRALSERQIPLTADYYNSGFIVFRSMALLKQWAEMAKSTPFHALFDQNLFNLMIHGMTVQPLERQVWNFHGRDFDREGGGADPMVLHLTSPKPHHYAVLECGFAGGQGGDYELRLLNRKPFLDRQFAVLEQFVMSESVALGDCGLLPADWPAGKFFVEWNIPRDRLCPCQSGKSSEQCHGAA